MNSLDWLNIAVCSARRLQLKGRTKDLQSTLGEKASLAAAFDLAIKSIYWRVKTLLQREDG